MWIGANVAQFYSFSMSQGDGKKDVTTLAEVFAKWAGVLYPFQPEA